MGFEPTTFTLATCQHRTEAPQTQALTSATMNVCTNACTTEPDSVHEDAPDQHFADGLAMIARLPLSDAEKAQAVRRLLAATAGEPHPSLNTIQTCKPSSTC